MKDLKYPPGSTPLDPDEIAGLKLFAISLQSELNEAEQANILEARTWALSRKHKELLTDTFAIKLHKRMFSDVWKWAGAYRKSDKSIGVPKEKIGTELHQVMKNTEAWIQYGSYPWEEITARFHHKLVLIHPFPNGNGRHSRLMTDILNHHYDKPACSWGAIRHGSQNLISDSELRASYISALKEADQNRFTSLIDFIYR